MVWSKDAPYKPESLKIRWELPKWTRGRGLDIGCGPCKPFDHFIGLDSGVTFMGQVKPDIRADVTTLPLFATGSMDFVFSSHTLEDFEYEAVPGVLAEWFRVIKVGGYLVLYLPDEDTYPRVGEDGANPAHKWNVTRERVIAAMEGHDYDLVDFQKRDQDDEYSLFFVFKKLPPYTNASREVSTSRDGDESLSVRKHLESWRNTQDIKRAGVVRYGAFGDLLQASSVLAGLKKQGFHVTLYTSPPGCEVISHDPNIDEVYMQDKDQVPNACLQEFWTWQSKKYDRWVNLSESVEGSFLTLPERTLHRWPPKLRHQLLDHNYLEVQHMLAGLPHEPAVKFFPSTADRAWAAKARQDIGGSLVMWALAGSSVHKTWAGLDTIIARMLLTYPTVKIALVGGPACKILEQGWENEPRVICTSGVWSIRQTLTMAQLADLVIGPETGVLNAVAQESMPKIVFLSHSTANNLTRDWLNTISLRSTNTSCPGRGQNEAPACHMMHYDWSHCRRTDNGTAQCMDDITIDETWTAVMLALDPRLARKKSA